MPTTRRLGRRPPDWTRPRAFARFPDQPVRLSPVADVDWLSRVTDWRMLLNDQLGDCVEAGILHALQSISLYGSGTEFEPTDDDARRLYEQIASYDPADPNSDQGTVVQDAYEHWRNKGINGHKLLAFAQIDHTSWQQVRAALYYFGVIGVGVNFPASAMDQFDAGKPWDVARPDGGIEGGHFILVGADPDSGNPVSVTWGQTQPLTPAWWAAYVEEAWTGVAPEWANAAGVNPDGLRWPDLAAAFRAVTGGTFTPPAPAPGPPLPPPDPAPVDPDLWAWWKTVGHWATDERHVGDNKHAAAACRKLAKAKRL